MKRLLLTFVLPLLACLTGGCFFSAPRAAAYYDLPAAPVQCAENFRISEFANDSGAGNRFQYREPDNRIVRDPNHKFVLEPGELVARTLRRMLCANGGKAELLLSGEVTVFETDLAENAFNFAGSFTLVKNDGKLTERVNFMISKKLSGNPSSDPSVVAEAAAQAVKTLSEEILKAAEADKP